MKSDDNGSCSKNADDKGDETVNDKKDPKSPKPSSSKIASFTDTQSDAESSKDGQDQLFEPTVDMLVNDFDEEQTLEEEEALAAKEKVDPTEELSDLQRESEMPIEELLKLYGCGPPVQYSSTSTSGTRKRRRRRESASKTKPETSETTVTTDTGNTQAEEVAAEEEDEDADAVTTTTTTTNNIENQSIDDETNYEDEEPSELKKLYTGLYERDEKDGELKSLSDDEDLDYCPDEEEGKKTIMIGLDYQAVIPEGLLKYDDALPYENEDKLLWDPSKVKDEVIEDYLLKFASAVNGANNHTSQTSTSTKHSRDDEQALLLLVQCGYNFEEALRRRRLGLSVVQPANTMIWSEDECKNFEVGLKLYGKCFHEIQHKVITRSVGELVEFYYLWKKTERADLFANKSRLEKKKYNLNPCVTDLMEKYLEEYDNGGTNREREKDRDRSASPNVNSNSLLHADTKRHRENCSTSSGGNNNHNQNSPDKLIKQNDDSTVIKTE